MCFLVPSLNVGGIEMYVLRFLNYIGDDAEAYTIVVRHPDKGDLFDAYRKTGAGLHFMPLGYANPLAMLRYLNFFRRNKFHTVCDFNANFAGVPLFLAKLAGVSSRLAFYRQGRDHFQFSWAKDLYNRSLNRMVDKYASGILSNSHAALNHFFPHREKSDERFHVIYNGIDKSLFKVDEQQSDIRNDLNIPLDKYVIGHTGRLDKAKNHGAILEVASVLLRERKDLHFVLCGTGTENLQARLDSMGLAPHFSVLGYRSDVPRVLKAFDLFFFPSFTEGQPNALIEAIIAGLPVVASDIDAIKECVPKAYWRYLAPPDAVEQFSDLIRQMIQKKAIIPGSWTDEHFSVSQNYDKLLKICYA